VQAYISNYTSHTKIYRLLFIAERNQGKPLELEALKLAADEVKQVWSNAVLLILPQLCQMHKYVVSPCNKVAHIAREWMMVFSTQHAVVLHRAGPFCAAAAQPLPQHNIKFSLLGAAALAQPQWLHARQHHLQLKLCAPVTCVRPCRCHHSRHLHQCACHQPPRAE
jgi:hypothetical protein